MSILVLMMRDPVMHYEVAAGRSACGRDLPTAGFFTDDLGILETREGSRCKACWRVLVSRGLVDGEPETEAVAQ
jgi:hypothetical protein